MEKEVTVNGRKYVLAPYNHEQQTIIKDESFTTVPGSDEIRTRIGMLNSLTVYFSLVKWEVKDKQGNTVSITPKLDLEGKNMQTLRNFRQHMPPNDMDSLFVEASKLQRMSDTEKKN